MEKRRRRWEMLILILFMLGLPNKKTEGDNEIEERQDKRGSGRYPRQNCIFGPVKQGRNQLLKNYIFLIIEKSRKI